MCPNEKKASIRTEQVLKTPQIKSRVGVNENILPSKIEKSENNCLGMDLNCDVKFGRKIRGGPNFPNLNVSSESSKILSDFPQVSESTSESSRNLSAKSLKDPICSTENSFIYPFHGLSDFESSSDYTSSESSESSDLNTADLFYSMPQKTSKVSSPIVTPNKRKVLTFPTPKLQVNYVQDSQNSQTGQGSLNLLVSPRNLEPDIHEIKH